MLQQAACDYPLFISFLTVYAHTTEKRPVMSRSVSLIKGKNNMIGISIGGGAPICPVLYVVQVSNTRGLRVTKPLVAVYASSVCCTKT